MKDKKVKLSIVKEFIQNVDFETYPVTPQILIDDCRYDCGQCDNRHTEFFDNAVCVDCWQMAFESDAE